MKIKRGDGLNIVPFIDVMLVLLALVLSISTFISQGKIKVEVPTANNAPQEQQDEEKPIVIVVSNDNKIYIDDVEKTQEELESFIAGIPNDKIVNFRGDKDSSLKELIFVIDQLTKKGHEHDKFRIDTQRSN
ncbi:TonB system transport protein ExbD [Helicobacter saguini]|uniref:Biopolymer transport protein ExbD n=1 Tax=Helicobacter saguini TaxID=1548018 RepID=A0A347VTN6_9HELI|nr:TonB system transport protein ExbD [Helicobacter saguini]MWV62024.1 TonB system transport protein ExbD [Helicobacter saguini]MWV67302.1 TonB system transport protein ExbD [Helicobacter saguini]MWV69655.1 TonB system transport protein ExbD [Helicobacter saguini]MWV73128.1 TonB system transport protein ExbD [Helicobacter saguini]TLD95508.1 TonB system transport protein ExbD [Helicobacter saguini]